MKLPAVMCMEGGYTIEAVGINMVNLLAGFKTRSDIFGVEKCHYRAWGRRHRHRKR